MVILGTQGFDLCVTKICNKNGNLKHSKITKFPQALIITGAQDLNKATDSCSVLGDLPLPFGQEGESHMDQGQREKRRNWLLF